MPVDVVEEELECVVERRDDARRRTAVGKVP